MIRIGSLSVLLLFLGLTVGCGGGQSSATGTPLPPGKVLPTAGKGKNVVVDELPPVPK